MTDSVKQDLDRYMDELRASRVSDLHMTIKALENHTYEDNTEVVYYIADDQLVITIDISEVEGKAFLESLDRKSTSKYVAEKTWVDKGSNYSDCDEEG